MTRIARLIMQVRPAYRFEDIMRLTHRQIMVLLEPERTGRGKIACGSYAEALALQQKIREQEDEDA